LRSRGFRATGKATAHDEVVAGELAKVLSGGDTDMNAALGEDDLLALERRHFLALLRTPGTVARIEHRLATGKPLRN
jgi:3-hydroxyacyl-CoA dehydrogenase